MTLDRYIAWRFLWMFARVFAGFAAIMFTIDMIERSSDGNLGDFQKRGLL